MTHAIDGFLVRETARRCNYDPEYLRSIKNLLVKYYDIPMEPRVTIPTVEQMAINHKFISLRGAEFITESNILTFSIEYRVELYELIDETLAHPSFPVLTIHDEFKCHPNYVNDIRKVYQGILAELADSNVGERIIQEVRNDPDYRLEKLSTSLGDEIMKSEYFLS